MKAAEITPEETARTGFYVLRGFLDAATQDAFVAEARRLAEVAPFLYPTMRDGRPLSVKVSSFGERGWWADREGYRYVERHPSGVAFPPIPEVALAATDRALRTAGHTRTETRLHEVDTCLVNLYAHDAVLGWHVDQTERDRTSPLVTFSIGAACTFSLRMEVDGETRTFRHRLGSGDAVVMAGPSRLAEHSVADVRDDPQAGLFGGAYNPVRATYPDCRLSFTVRRSGFAGAEC
jgi:alkylated DNA repair protein (DNA oxidative demethylase)